MKRTVTFVPSWTRPRIIPPGFTVLRVESPPQLTKAEAVIDLAAKLPKLIRRGGSQLRVNIVDRTTNGVEMDFTSPDFVVIPLIGGGRIEVGVEVQETELRRYNLPTNPGTPFARLALVREVEMFAVYTIGIGPDNSLTSDARQQFEELDVGRQGFTEEDVLVLELERLFERFTPLWDSAPSNEGLWSVLHWLFPYWF